VKSFRAHLLEDPEVAGRISAAALDAAFDPGLHTRAVETIFARVFG
jgi:adenylosuccinate lyase